MKKSNTSKLTILVTSFTLLTGILPAQTGTLSGIISGNVTNDQGKPVSAAMVTLSKLPALLERSPRPFEQKTGSLKDGAFFFGSLTPGQYELCVSLALSTLLDPCVWKTQATKFNLSAGQMIVNVKLVLKQGVVVPIRIEDQGNLISTNSNKAGAHILVGVPLPNGLIMPAKQSSNKGQLNKGPGLDFEVLVPSDKDFNVIVASPKFQMSDETGKPFKANPQKPANANLAPAQAITAAGPVENVGKIPMRVSSGTSPKVVTVRITGIQ